MAGVNTWRFPDLKGSVLWVPDRLEVTNATSGLYGGPRSSTTSLRRSARRTRRPARSGTSRYRDVEPAAADRFPGDEGLRLGGTRDGRNHLEWQLGKWAEKRGSGEVTATAPPGAATDDARVPARRARRRGGAAAARRARSTRARRSDTCRSPGTSPTRSIPTWITLDQSWVATPKTYVEFHGRTA